MILICATSPVAHTSVHTIDPWKYSSSSAQAECSLCARLPQVACRRSRVRAAQCSVLVGGKEDTRRTCLPASPRRARITCRSSGLRMNDAAMASTLIIDQHQPPPPCEQWRPGRLRCPSYRDAIENMGGGGGTFCSTPNCRSPLSFSVTCDAATDRRPCLLHDVDSAWEAQSLEKNKQGGKRRRTAANHPPSSQDTRAHGRCCQ